MNKNWKPYEESEILPVEMRFVDMFMTAIGALVFLAMVLIFLIPRSFQERQEFEKLKKQLQELKKNKGAGRSGDGPIVRNYHIFQNKRVYRYGEFWLLNVGHLYTTSVQTNTNWTKAYCYIKKKLNGLDTTLWLAHRSSPWDKPTGPNSDFKILKAFNLSEASIIGLAKACPWIDEQRYAVEEFNPRKPFSNPFRSTTPELVLDNHILRYKGLIVKNMISLLRKHEFKILEINSSGGLVQTAMKAGKWLRQNGKAVLVGEECLSACPYLVAGGTLRALGANSRIGVHKFRCLRCLPAVRQQQKDQDTTIELADHLTKMGVSLDLWKRTKGVEPDRIELISNEEVREWKLINTDTSSKEWQRLLGRNNLLNGVDLYGSDIRPSGYAVEKLGLCIDMCRKEKRCLALTFVASKKLCFLKHSVPKRSARSDATSWIK